MIIRLFLCFKYCVAIVADMAPNSFYVWLFGDGLCSVLFFPAVISSRGNPLRIAVATGASVYKFVWRCTGRLYCYAGTVVVLMHRNFSTGVEVEAGESGRSLVSELSSSVLVIAVSLVVVSTWFSSIFVTVFFLIFGGGFPSATCGQHSKHQKTCRK